MMGINNRLCGKITCIFLLLSGFFCNAYAQTKPDTVQSAYFKEIKSFSEPFVRQMRRNQVQMYSLPPNTFTTKVDSVRALLLATLHKYEDKLTPAFIKGQ